MIGFSIMMWFAALILFVVGISLLKGNISSLHGKVFENTTDKAGYGKAMGKPVLFIGIAVFICGVMALLFSQNIVMYMVLPLFVITIIIALLWFVRVQNKYK